jgi:voltage-gated potassium channel
MNPVDKDMDDIRREYHVIHRQYLITAGAAVGVLVIGAAIYHHLLHLSWVNAFYFCTITLATVGYGDITPTTNASKIFTIFYIFVGIGIFASFASLLIRNASLRRELRRAKRRQ